MTVDIPGMKFLITPILLCILININAAIDSIEVANSEQLIEKIKLVIQQIHRNSKQLKNLYTEIQLKPGYYIIPPNEKFFENEYVKLKARGLMDVQQNRLNIVVKYPWPNNRESIFKGSVKEALMWLQEKLSIGISLDNEIIYSVNSDKELYMALLATISNRQNTVIKIPRCMKYPCVRNKSWLNKIYTLTMPSSDGMRLRINSKFSSLDQEKWRFFGNKIKPFTEAY